MANASPSREEITRNVHTSIDVDGLVTSMREKIEKLPRLSGNCCIFRVSKRLREVNQKAYTPLAVSIGPFHHGKPGLQAMEEHKWRYVRDFLERSQKPIGEFVEFIRAREERIRECYVETICLNSDQFVEIVLVDAAFIIEIFMRKYSSFNLRRDDDRICRKPGMFHDIRCDFLLLENQIPFFVLEDLFVMANIAETTTTLIEATCEFFADTLQLPNSWPVQEIDSWKVEHLTDFLRNCLITRELRSQQLKMGGKVEFIRTATELKEAGVKFKAGSNENLIDIKFSRGVLEIPHIQIFDITEVLLRNVLAFEQCRHGTGYVSDYVATMDHLINTSKDVELLVHSGVIENWLGDSRDVSNLFNKLFTEIMLDNDSFHFSQLSKELNDHCRNPCNNWKATLRHDYFKTPWRVLSIVAAAILLLLTFIQAVCSIISVDNY